MNRKSSPYPKLRLATWPLSSSSEAYIGCGDVALHYGSSYPARSMYLPLRSEERFEAIYVVIGVFLFEDGKASVEANLKDIHRASLREAKGLIALLEQVQKRVDKALVNWPAYIPIESLGDALLQVFNAIGAVNVVEYRGIGQPDVVRPLSHSDVTRYVTVADRIVSSIKLKAA